MLSGRSQPPAASVADALSEKERRFVVVAPLVVAAAIAALYLLSPPVYFFVVMEYMVVEDLQVLLYALAMVLSAVLARRLWIAGGDTRLMGVLYGVAAVGLFFVAGEEISWGGELFERILPFWPDKEELRRVNAQGETTLHNLHGLGHVFTWFLFALSLFAVLSPLLRAALGRWGRRPWLDYVVFPRATFPGLLIAVAFFVALLFLTGSHHDVPQGTAEHAFLRFQEVAELDISFSIAVFVLSLLRMTSAGRGGGPVGR